MERDYTLMELDLHIRESIWDLIKGASIRVTKKELITKLQGIIRDVETGTMKSIIEDD